MLVFGRAPAGDRSLAFEFAVHNLLLYNYVNFPIGMILEDFTRLYVSSPSIGLTNLAKPYHVHYHLSQPDMAGQPRLGRGATRRAKASVQRFALLADVRGNKACSICFMQIYPYKDIKNTRSLLNVKVKW